ncbi:hypothetical protein RF11_01824 [Thelohanellus kitauei]|uniref:Uncharacterized protein n=1 Tax=Thelohanellus kitauei TaxID=669202 RepID=A0A0C2IVD2_THEKT|nr:hypothetical protein RF11_01824 [Thelohanellus kitauei]
MNPEPDGSEYLTGGISQHNIHIQFTPIAARCFFGSWFDARSPELTDAELPNQECPETRAASAPDKPRGCKDKCGDSSTSEVSWSVSMYHVGKLEFKIGNGTDGLVILARVDYSHLNISVSRCRSPCFEGTVNSWKVKSVYRLV